MKPRCGGLLLLFAVACATSPAGPPEVRWGVDECSHCHMIVGEPRFAAVARGPAGEEARFDDLGCAVGWHTGGDRRGWRLWVHEAGGERWLDAAAARFVRDDRLATPMGSGLTAHVVGALPSGRAALTWRELTVEAAAVARRGEPVRQDS